MKNFIQIFIFTIIFLSIGIGFSHRDTLFNKQTDSTPQPNESINNNSAQESHDNQASNSEESIPNEPAENEIGEIYSDNLNPESPENNSQAKEPVKIPDGNLDSPYSNPNFPPPTPVSEFTPQIMPELLTLAENLHYCSPFKTTHTFPIGGRVFEREILGIIDGKCVYKEELPDGEVMECAYSEEDRWVVAEYYMASTEINSPQDKVQIEILGTTRTVTNVIQEKILEGTCVVSDPDFDVRYDMMGSFFL